MKVRTFLNALRLFLMQVFNIVINISFAFVLQQDLLNLLLATLSFSSVRTLEILALVCLVFY